jgi:hypothetical protein
MSVIEKLHNPVLDFQLDGYGKIFGKRHFKSKLNRLNRAGKLKFERITDYKVLEKEFPKIAQYQNIRQGAAFNKTPFPHGIKDWQVFLEWLKNGVLHVTGLWLDGKLIGAVIMINDFGKTAHLAGLITYSPLHAKFSPGLVHLYLVSQLLKEESFQDLKLSPGYDAYKDRFSNRQEEIYELLISSSQIQIIKRKLRILIRRVLLTRRIRPMELEVWLSKTKSKWENRFWAFSKKSKMGNMSLETILSMINTSEEKIEGSYVDFSNQNLDSLLLVDDKTFNVSRWEFLMDSLDRFEKNERFITYVDKGKLKICIWYKGDEITIKELTQQNLGEKISKIYISPAIKFFNP